MEIKEKKIGKYNFGEPIKLDLIPIEECEEALHDFSNGSNGMEKCLRTMWMNGLKTHSCYPGNDNVFDIGYIVMTEGEDIFCYLSEEFLNDDSVRINIEDNRQVIKFACNHGENTPFDIGHIVMEENEDVFSYLSKEFIEDERVRINIIDNMQEIRFAGSTPEKEGAMLFLARDIQSGKKKNTRELIMKKIGEPYPDSWIRVLKNHDSNINSTYWSGKVYIKEKTQPKAV